MKFNLTQNNFFFQSALMSTISFKIFRSALTWSHFKKLVHNALFLKRFVTQCVCTCLKISQERHVWICWSWSSRAKLIAKIEIYLKNVFTMRDYLKRFVTQWVCIRLIICQQSHVWFCWSSKAKLIAKPNMYKFFIVFEKKWEKNVINLKKGWYITSSLFSNLDLYAFCLNSGSICTRLNVRL